MRVTKGITAWVLACSALLGVACSDHTLTVPDASEQSRDAGQVAPSRDGKQIPADRMNALLRQVTREVAIALADQSLREQVYAALKASPYREHKIHFGPFLRGPGRPLLEGMGAARRASPGAALSPGAAGAAEAVLGSLDSIVDLEFYMPVKAHFASWSGGTNVIVASALRDDGRTPDGFDLAGRPVRLDPSRAPTIPTLVVVPVETDFSPAAALAPAGVDAATEDIPGAYMTRAIIYDDHEGWPNGDPEFEVHLFQTDIDHEYIDQICAGQQQTPPYQWNHEETQDWTGTVLIATEGRLALTENNQFQMWEDDTGPCTSTGGRPPDTEGATVSQYASWLSAILAIVPTSSNPPAVSVIRNILNAIPATYNFASAFFQDEEVGTFTLPGRCWPGINGVPDAGPVWFWLQSSEGGHPLRGSAQVDMRFNATREPICELRVVVGGASFTYEGTNYTWSANVSYGSPPYSYQWYRDGVPAGTSATYNETVFMPNFDLRVVVTDAVGKTASGLRRVTVSNCTPPQKTC